MANPGGRPRTRMPYAHYPPSNPRQAIINQNRFGTMDMDVEILDL